MTEHILKITCADAPGLIYKIMGVLFTHGYNVVRNQEFVDADTEQFFMRTVVQGRADLDPALEELRRVLPAGHHVGKFVSGPRPVVLLATREAHCLGDLLLRHADGELNADLRAVVSNHAHLGKLVERFEIPFVHVSHEGVSRIEHERRVVEVVESFAPEYLVLAKYMRILTPFFVSRYPHRILNIHHSFLPAFIGARPYHQAFERGVKLIGATAHLVTEDLDTGPIIAQDVVHVHHGYTAEDMVRAGRDVEKVVLARALRLVLEERVFVHGNRTIVFD